MIFALICEIAASPWWWTTLQFLHQGRFQVAWLSIICHCFVFAKDYATEGLPESAYGYYRSWAKDLESMFGLGFVSLKFFVVSWGNHKGSWDMVILVSFQTQSFLGPGFWKWTPANSGGGSDVRCVIQGKYGYRMPSCTTKTATWF